MTGNALRSIDLHLDYPAGEVVAVDELVDVGAGMYPVYYTRRDGRVLASTSVAELIVDLGTFERDPAFDPPDFLGRSDDGSLLDRLEALLPDALRAPIPPTVAPKLRDLGLLGGEPAWYGTSNTADSRIAVLEPFERVTPDDRVREFEPTYSLDDRNEFVERSAREIRQFVNGIERQYPEHHHVVRVGGRDSQLITLVPKVTDRWHVFSAEPNHGIVDRFLAENGVEVGEFFHHDNANEESREEFRRKVICSDLRVDPRHLRWYPTLERIVDRFDGNCIFWIGTVGEQFNTYYPFYHDSGRFFERHFTRAAKWQGVTHQVTKNYTGAAALSPYHSESIWENLYRVHDPGMMAGAPDLRPAIAAQWYDRDLWWAERNPAPEPYEYDFGEGYHREYFEYIRERLDGEAESVVGREETARPSHSGSRN
jgi:hypothetical protein